MKKISIRAWLAIQTLLIIGIILLDWSARTLGFLNVAVLDALCIFSLFLMGYMEKKREVVDEFSVVALSKANEVSLKVVLISIIFALVYVQSMNSKKEVIGLMLGGIIVLSFAVKLVTFIIVDKKGIDYAKNED